MVYVTFHVKPTILLQSMGYRTGYFAILCNNDDQAHEVASNVYSIDGVRYVKINKSLRVKHKETKVLSCYSNYEKEISILTPNNSQKV